jgi:FtsH-binding integral membrane protein
VVILALLSTQGIMSRVYETVAVLFLLAILICGLAGILSALLDSDKAGRKAFFGEQFCFCMLASLLLMAC